MPYPAQNGQGFEPMWIRAREHALAPFETPLNEVTARRVENPRAWNV